MSAARARSACIDAYLNDMIADELEIRREAQELHEDEIARWHAHEHDMMQRERA